jgi:hypothetical protein
LVQEAGQSNGSQNTNDDDNNQQFDEGKPLIGLILARKTLEKFDLKDWTHIVPPR